jgi:hypothetical protein
MNIDQVTRALEQLEAELPQMLRDLPDEADFWPVFSRQADHILDNADAEHYGLAWRRINCILVSAGLAPLADAMTIATGPAGQNRFPPRDLSSAASGAQERT